VTRLGNKGTDFLTVAHKLIALAWVVATVALLLRAGSAEPAPAWEWTASAAAVTTLVVGTLYGLLTTYGFVRNRWVTVKWLLTLFALAAGAAAVGGGISARLTLACRAAQLAAFVAAGAIGICLERSRHRSFATPREPGSQAGASGQRAP
jgi:hypothetical protein